MNQTAVAARVATNLGTIAQLKSVIQGFGDTNAAIASEYPLVMYSVGEPQPAGWITMGSVYEYYDIALEVWLGTPEMLAQDAEQVRLTISDKMRAVFSQDPTLAGNCLVAVLSGGTNNLQTFREQEDTPKMQYKLSVQEYTLASSAGN